MLVSSSIDNELLNFIESKKNVILDVSSKDIYNLYCKMIIDILYNVHTSFNNIHYSISCCELAHCIFLIILHYTNNTKLAMFLCDRAKILFIEYINISYEMNSDKELDITDVKIYIYSKTIGPLNMSSKKNNKIYKLTNLFILYKNLIYKLYSKIKIDLDDKQSYKELEDNIESEEEEEEIYLEEIKDEDNIFSIYKDKLFYSIDTIKEKLYLKLYKCYFLLNNLYLENTINKEIEQFENIFIFVNKLNLTLQLIIDIQTKYKKKKCSTFIHIINKSINDISLDQYNNIYINNGNIKKNIIYKEIFNNI